MHARARTHTHAHARARKSQQASEALLWELRGAPEPSSEPGGDGTEHLANQLQLSPRGLKVNPPTPHPPPPQLNWYDLLPGWKREKQESLLFLSGWLEEVVVEGKETN